MSNRSETHIEKRIRALEAILYTDGFDDGAPPTPEEFDYPAGIGGGGGAFEDTDDDGIAELQAQHATFQGGDARNVGAFDAEAVTVGVPPRPAISNGGKTLYVDPVDGSDSNDGTEAEPLATIEEAASRVPVLLRDEWTIDLATAPSLPVTYDEDVLIETVIGTGQAGQEQGAPEAGPINNLVIRGDVDTPSNVEIGSLMFGNCLGVVSANLLGARILRDSPYDDENCGFASYGPGEVRGRHLEFSANVTNGIISYGSAMKVNHINLGAGNLQHGIRAKRGATVNAVNVSGTTNGSTYRAEPNLGRIVVDHTCTATGSPTFEARASGTVAHRVDYDPRIVEWYGIDDWQTIEGWDLANTLDTTLGAGSIEFLHDRAEFREPGDAAAQVETRAYDPTVAFDADEETTIRWHIKNVTLDDNVDARMNFNALVTPDVDEYGGVKGIGIRLRGDGHGTLELENDAGNTINKFSNMTNAEMETIEFVELTWDGTEATFTIRTSDGNKNGRTESANYPTGERLYLKVGAYDADGSAARNVDFDLERVEIQ